MKEYDSAKELHASTVYIEQIVIMLSYPVNNI